MTNQTEIRAIIRWPATAQTVRTLQHLLHRINTEEFLELPPGTVRLGYYSWDKREPWIRLVFFHLPLVRCQWHALEMAQRPKLAWEEIELEARRLQYGSADLHELEAMLEVIEPGQDWPSC